MIPSRQACRASFWMSILDVKKEALCQNAVRHHYACCSNEHQSFLDVSLGNTKPNSVAVRAPWIRFDVSHCHTQVRCTSRAPGQLLKNCSSCSLCHILADDGDEDEDDDDNDADAFENEYSTNAFVW